MANKSQRAVLHYISGAITAAEEKHKVTLPGVDHELLTNLLLETVDLMVDKFVAGSAKHGGNLSTRNNITELHMELLDALVYHAALRRQLSTMFGGVK